MIRRAQLKFICITMSILLGVFSAIYFGITAIIKYSHRQFIEHSLDETFNSSPFNGEYASDKIIIVNDTIICGDKLGKVDVMKLYGVAKKELSNGASGQLIFGKYNFYYKFYPENSDTKRVFIATEISDNLHSLKMNNFSAFTFLLIVYVIIFIVVWSLSYKVFQPIKNSFEKQKRFISDASHELKTPLTIISANADVLKQNGENSQYLDNIKSQTERMDGLVADMLSLAKFDEGRFNLENQPFDVSEAVTECVLPFEALAYEKNKKLLFNISPYIVYCGDRPSLKKITNILMDNAVKYSDGEILVNLKREGGKTVILSVQNSGSNVNAKDADKVFERFYSGENSHARTASGSGLGLSIAKSIADANKWKISAESELGVSMKITLTMKIKN